MYTSKNKPGFLVCSLLLIFLAVIMWGCPSRGYPTRFAKLTNYKIRRANAQKTEGGVLYDCPAKCCDKKWRANLDKKVKEVEQCIGQSVNRDWFMVYIPKDYWTSKCTGNQMIAAMHPIWKGCATKEIKIKPECRKVLRPTEKCPCPCALRAVIQDHWAIVTTPSLYIFKSELIRIVTGENNPWIHPVYKKCLP